MKKVLRVFLLIVNILISLYLVFGWVCLQTFDSLAEEETLLIASEQKTFAEAFLDNPSSQEWVDAKLDSDIKRAKLLSTSAEFHRFSLFVLLTSNLSVYLLFFIRKRRSA